MPSHSREAPAYILPSRGCHPGSFTSQSLSSTPYPLSRKNLCIWARSFSVSLYSRRLVSVSPVTDATSNRACSISPDVGWRWDRELEHLLHALARDPEMARRRALAHPVPARQTDLAIQLHPLRGSQARVRILPPSPPPERADTLAESCSAAAGPSRRYRGLVLRRRLHPSHRHRGRRRDGRRCHSYPDGLTAGAIGRDRRVPDDRYFCSPVCNVMIHSDTHSNAASATRCSRRSGIPCRAVGSGQALGRP